MITSFPPLSGLLRQKMNRSGGSTPYGNVKIDGMVSDATYPSNVSSNELIVARGGNATINGSFTTSNSFDGISGTMWINGVNVGTIDRGGTTTGTLSINRAVANGDRIWLQANNGSGGSITAASVEVIPA